MDLHNEDDDSLSSDTDNSESSHEGLDNAEEVVTIYKSDSEVHEPEIRETDVETDGTRNFLQLLDHPIVVACDDLDDVKKKVPYNKKPTLMWEDWEKETEKWLDQHMTEDVSLENLNEIVAETVDPSPDFILPLLRYQKEWLAWGLKQEESASKGGILADEMGMGKTVQAIALVLAKRALCREVGEPVELVTNSSTGLPCVKTTLVICPSIAVMQWVNEIDRFTTKGSNKVLAYHGRKRGKTLLDLSGYDFIITTYSIVENEYQKNIMPPKEICPWCGKKFYTRALKTHMSRHFDGFKTVKQSKQCKKKGKLEEKSSFSKENLCFLHSVKWTRIILDEADNIKERGRSTARTTRTARAVFALESSYKWALSGTPFHNRVRDVYSLVRFLQITPYSYYFCKDCDCKVLEFTTSSTCLGCPHRSVRHFCWWNKYIAIPISHNNTGRRARAMILLKEKVLKCILLRRTKKDRAADLALPPRMISLRCDYLDIAEKEYYTSLERESQEYFNRYVEEGSLMSNYGHITNLLTRLLQAVDHHYLVVYSKSAVSRSTSEKFCGLCHNVAEDPVVTSCEHLFCKSCLIGPSTSIGQHTCPSCSEPLAVDFIANMYDQEIRKPNLSLKGFKPSSILNRIPLENFQTSTKIEALKEEIRFMVERDGSAKGIVFSQFTSFLDLIHYSLQKSGVKCVQLDGSMSMATREAAITRFNNDGDCRIFLISLKTGGVALNLTIASHVFMIDPWWDPDLEQQAQDRIYQIGQYKPIRVVRFVINNTIEEKIMKLQEIRKLRVEGAVDGCSEALGKLNHDDLMDLFLHP